MIVRYYWRNCALRGGTSDAPAIDALWVEATQQEAESSVFPSLTPQKISESIDLAKHYINVAEKMGAPARAFCYLVARDLSSIDPRPPHYPVHQLWNAYSPFRPMPEISISNLRDLLDITLPD